MRRSIGLLLALVVVLAGCGGDADDDGNGNGAAAGETVAVSARDFAFEPSDVTLDAAGTYTFRLTNDGESPHALEIEGEDLEEETDTIDPGDSDELTVDLAEGEYVLYCPVGDHRDRGMEGRLVVGGGGMDAGETETDEDEDDDDNGDGEDGDDTDTDTDADTDTDGG